jgi:hypothetical protein
MSLTLRGNRFFVKQDEKAFVVARNFTNYVELGVRGVTPYYLEARVVDNEFLIDAILLDQSGKFVCELVGNKVKPGRRNKSVYKRVTHGFNILSQQDESEILGMRIRQNLCLLEGAIYGIKGEIIAKAQGADFLVFKGPAVIGKSGQSYGLVIQ